MTRHNKIVLTKLIIWTVTALVLVVINNIVMLNMHPLEYYYTLRGMGISLCVMAVEFPVNWLFFRWVFGKKDSK